MTGQIRIERARTMNSKKTMSLLLSFVLIFSSLTGVFVETASAEEVAKKIIVYVAAEGTSGENEVQIYKTPVQLLEGDTAQKAVLEVLDYYYKDEYTYDDGKSELSAIDSVKNSQTTSQLWRFHVNGEEPQTYSIGNYPVKNQDRISLVYGVLENLPAECSSYGNDTSVVPDEGTQTALVEQAKKQQNLLAQKIYETEFQSGKYVPGITDTDGLYDVFSLVQADFSAGEFYDAVASRVISELQALQDGKSVLSVDGKTSYDLKSYEGNQYVVLNYGKIALVLSALGQDITDVAGMDLTEKLTNQKNFENALATTLTRESVILFAMNGIHAKWQDRDAVKEEELVKAIVDDVDAQVKFSTDWTSAWGATLDSAAMSIQALAPYLAEGAETAVSAEVVQEAKEKVENVFQVLSTMQGSDGGYEKINAQNPWVLAQVLMTVGLFGKNPVSNPEFIRDGKTLFDAVAAYVDIEKGTIDENLMGYAPSQMLRGLSSGIRAAEGKAGVYDLHTPTYQAKITEWASEDAQPTEEQQSSEDIKDVKATNACKSIEVKKTYTVKKGKTVKVFFDLTLEDDTKETTDVLSAKKMRNKKIATIQKAVIKNGRVQVKVKGKKKGKTVLTIQVGRRTAKTTIRVK